MTIQLITQQPTYLELLAADRIVPAIEAVIVHSLAVYAQQNHGLARVLNWQDEIAAAVILVLESNAIFSDGASFSEGLYGLTRVRGKRQATWSSPGASQPLRLKQKLRSLALLTIFPYLKAKLRVVYDANQAQHLLHAGSRPLSLSQCAAPALALLELLDFGTQAAYLLLGFRWFSWTHAAAGVDIIRRQADSAERREKPPARGLQAALRGGVSAIKAALVATVVGIKVLEWWYLVAEKRLEARLPEAVPPPPPPPTVDARGAMLLAQEGCCPLCAAEYAMPAQLAVSGFVFCYACIVQHVRNEGTCPVTHLEATEAHVRRLYLEA